MRTVDQCDELAAAIALGDSVIRRTFAFAHSADAAVGGAGRRRRTGLAALVVGRAVKRSRPYVGSVVSQKLHISRSEQAGLAQIGQGVHAG